MAGRPRKVLDEPLASPSLDRIIAEINRKFGSGSIGRATKIDLDIRRVSTGIKGLDQILGGGLPFGRMVELYGQPSGGKSLISFFTIAQAQGLGLDCVYIDVENSFDPVFVASLGVDLSKLVVLRLSTGEEIFDAVLKLLEHDNIGVIVIDSVAAMIVNEENEKEFSQNMTMASKARLMSRALPKLNAKNHGTLLLFINQIRNTLVMYGSPNTTPGGKALQFLASIRVEVKRTDLVRQGDKKKGIPIGQIVGFHITKNKAGGEGPFKEGSFKFYYDDFRVEEGNVRLPDDDDEDEDEDKVAAGVS